MAEIYAFLKLEGVDGETPDAHYEKHLSSSPFHGAPPTTAPTQPAPVLASARGQVHNMSFSKFMCMGSPKLMERVIKGWPCNTGKLICASVTRRMASRSSTTRSIWRTSSSPRTRCLQAAAAASDGVVFARLRYRETELRGASRRRLWERQPRLWVGPAEKIKKRKPEPKRRVDAIHHSSRLFKHCLSEKPVPTVSGMFQSGRVAL